MNVNTPAPTEAQIKAAIGIMMAVAEAIKSLGSVPSGELYAHVMGHMDLDTYESIIRRLVSMKLVKRDGHHLLTWIGD